MRECPRHDMNQSSGQSHNCQDELRSRSRDMDRKIQQMYQSGHVNKTPSDPQHAGDIPHEETQSNSDEGVVGKAVADALRIDKVRRGIEMGVWLQVFLRLADVNLAPGVEQEVAGGHNHQNSED